MEKQRKTRALAFLGAAVVILILLSASLPQLELHAGRPFSLGKVAAAISEGDAPQGGGEIFLLVFRGVLTLALVLLPFYIIINLLTPEGRGRLLADLLAILLIILLLRLLPKNLQGPATQETQAPVSSLAPFMPTSSGPTDQFVARVPPWLDVLAVAALATLVSGAIAGLLWWTRKRAKSVSSRPLERLAQKAQETIDALRAGENVRDTVIRCYIQMSWVLQQERGIRRESAMTPYEFEQLLKEKGLPTEPVQGLTRLFEKVRYGNQTPGEREGHLAITSLQAIIAHCKGVGARQ